MQIQREKREATVFETDAPFARPIIEVAPFVHFARQIFLFVADLAFHPIDILEEVSEDVWMRIGFEPIHRRIAGLAPRLGPIFDDAELTRMIEETIN